MQQLWHNSQNRPIVFILWGAPAQRKASMLNNPNHLILKAPHQVRFPLTVVSLEVNHLARRINSWKQAVWNQSTGRLISNN